MEMRSYRHEFSAMGSSFLIRLDEDARGNGSVVEFERLFAALEQETERLEQCMSRFRRDSELTLLNGQVGKPVVISKTLNDVLSLAETMRVWSSGAFDPRVLRVLEDIGYHGAPLAQVQIENAPPEQRVYREIARFPERVLVEIDEPIDLGGIGKGYAVDVLAQEISRFSSTHPLTGYFVDAGGDMVIGGCQNSGDPWSIGVEDPVQETPLVAALTIPLVEGQRVAVCTSSVRRKTWVKSGQLLHHLIDPVSRTSALTRYLAVTAMAPRAAIAEVATKYVFLRGVEGGPLWNHIPAVFLTVDAQRALSFTSGMRAYISWLHSEMKLSQLSL